VLNSNSRRRFHVLNTAFTPRAWRRIRHLKLVAAGAQHLANQKPKLLQLQQLRCRELPPGPSVQQASPRSSRLSLARTRDKWRQPVSRRRCGRHHRGRAPLKMRSGQGCAASAPSRWLQGLSASQPQPAWPVSDERNGFLDRFLEAAADGHRLPTDFIAVLNAGDPRNFSKAKRRNLVTKVDVARSSRGAPVMSLRIREVYPTARRAAILRREPVAFEAAPRSGSTRGFHLDPPQHRHWRGVSRNWIAAAVHAELSRMNRDRLVPLGAGIRGRLRVWRGTWIDRPWYPIGSNSRCWQMIKACARFRITSRLELLAADQRGSIRIWLTGLAF